MCEWEHHEMHDDENDVFYAPILAYVTDRGRLVSNTYIQIYNMIDHSCERLLVNSPIDAYS